VSFEIHLSSIANKFLKSADKELYNRIINKLKKLAEYPIPHDAKRVMGQTEKVFRVRVGDYRVLYVVFLDKNAILVVNIDKRSKVYNR
jgi:mRNA interferase RelE/StbE